MSGDRGHCGVGEVVCGNIDRLDRGDGRAGDRGNSLLQGGDLARQRRLIADPRRQASQQAGNFGAGLDEAKHVVHQQQHILMLLVAKILRDRQRRQRSAPARARRLVHLSVDEHRPREHAGALHFGQEFVTFARALTDAGENRDSFVFLDHRMDQLHHQHGLADAGAAEHRGLAALGERREQIDHLDAGLEHIRRRRLAHQSGRRIMDAAPRRIRGKRWSTISWPT